jgi:hypothetical protein
MAPDDNARAVQVLREARDAGRLPLDEVSLYGSRVHVTGSELAQHREAVAAELSDAGIEPGEISLIEPSLEDVFIEYMR